MNNKHLSILILVVLFGVQFLVVPTFSLMAQGGKVAAFSWFVMVLAACLLIQNREWCLPKALIPLGVLFLVFSISLLNSQWPAMGLVHLFTFATGLIFCVLVVNLSGGSDALYAWVSVWCRLIGVVVALLCLYQYLDWVLFGQKTTMLIPYLLPPGSSRVGGIYGQPNQTALLLLVSVIAFIGSYGPGKISNQRFKQLCIDIGMLLVSTAFFLTRSSAGLLALALFLGVFCLLVCRRKIIFNNRSLLKIGLLLSAGFLVSHLPLTADSYTKAQVNIESRYVFWASSVLMFSKFPILGVGLDHFKLYLPSYARPAHDLLGFVQFESMGYTSWSHNEYLQILAESGLVGFSLLGIFFILLGRIISKEVLKEKPDSKKLFIFFMMSPFFVQGMFSWNFRHPALFFIFFLLLGIAIKDSSHVTIKFNNFAKISILFLLLISLSGVFIISFKEYQYVQLKKHVKENGCKNSEIFSLIDDSYLEFRVLREVLPLCLADESFTKDLDLVEQLKPSFVKIASLQGTEYQWYNLGFIYKALGEYELADASFKTAVERQPVFERGWAALHTLNIEKAVRMTGRPIEEFLPPESTSSMDFNNLLSK